MEWSITLGCCWLSEGCLNCVYDDNADSTGLNKPEMGRTPPATEQMLVVRTMLNTQYNTIYTRCKMNCRSHYLQPS